MATANASARPLAPPLPATCTTSVAGGLPVLLDDGTRKYVWGAAGLAYSVDKTSAAVQVYYTDGLGSVRAITDSTGSVVQTYQTDEFGIPTLSQGTSAQPFGYTGEQGDSTGLIYLRARMYDPLTGRFFQRDSHPGTRNAPHSLSPFTYARNNPVAFTDPSGFNPEQNNVLQNEEVQGPGGCSPAFLPAA